MARGLAWRCRHLLAASTPLRRGLWNWKLADRFIPYYGASLRHGQPAEPRLGSRPCYVEQDAVDVQETMGISDVNRRHLLSWGAMTGAWFGLKPRLGFALTAAAPAPAADKLLAIFSRRGSAAVVGASWLEQLDQPPALPELERDVLEHLGLSEQSLAASDLGSLRQRVQARLSDDFANGRTISVQGWVLGQTEVQLCGLAALSASV